MIYRIVVVLHAIALFNEWRSRKSTRIVVGIFLMLLFGIGSVTSDFWAHHSRLSALFFAGMCGMCVKLAQMVIAGANSRSVRELWDMGLIAKGLICFLVVIGMAMFVGVLYFDSWDAGMTLAYAATMFGSDIALREPDTDSTVTTTFMAIPFAKKALKWLWMLWT